MREADVRWASALRGLDSYPDRLRTFADAAEEQSRALTLADLANVRWKPRPGARKLRFPFEVDPTGERPGPPTLWGKFDRGQAAGCRARGRQHQADRRSVRTALGAGR